MGRGRSGRVVEGKSVSRRRISARAAEPDYEGWYADPARNDERIAAARRSGDYVPGANGTERPFRARSGARLLWCWRPATGEHNYLDCDADLIVSGDTAGFLLGDDTVTTRTPPLPFQRKREIGSYLPDELKRAGYYNAINLQHFNPATAIGSVFTNIKSLGRLLEACIFQRGSLNGDDREELMTLGANPGAFMDPASGVRYLKVIADGESGIVDASRLDPATPVRVVRTKAGTPCSLVVDGARRQPTFVGTIIIGPNQGPDSAFENCVWTAHPGLPIVPASEDIWPEGAVISAGEVLAYFRGQGQEEVALKVEEPRPAEPVPVGDAFSAVVGDHRGSAPHS